MRYSWGSQSGFGRGILVGLVTAAVVMLALPVVAAVGGNLILGQSNSADGVTSLSGDAGVNLRVTNTRAGSPALELRVVAGAPPLKVNSTARVANLNADRLDGNHASAFLLAGGTAADSQLLDGLDSTAFSPAGHGHAGVYLPLAGIAVDSQLLDGLDSTAFSPASHTHAASAITSGILSTSRYSAWADLDAEGYLNATGDDSVLLLGQAKDRFLAIGQTAADSELLDGLDSSAFSAASHTHAASAITSGTLATSLYSAFSDLQSEGYLDNDDGKDLLLRDYSDERYVNEGDTAANAELLDGREATAFAGSPCPPGVALVGYGRSGPLCGGSVGSVLVDANDDVGSESAMVLDPDGRPVIAYYNATDDQLELIRCGNPSCTAGNSQFTIDSLGNVGVSPSLVLDANGYPVISYYDVDDGDLKLAHCSTPDCYTRSIRVVDGGGNVGLHSSVTLNGSGNPVISYRDGTTPALVVAICGDPLCASVAGGVRIGGSPEYTSLVLDGSGFPVVAYYETGGGNLILYRCHDATCGTATMRTIDSASDVGQYASLALDEADFPVISYYDATANDLKIVHCGDATCSAGNTIRTVDSAGLVGRFTSLALDAQGNPLVSYLETATGFLKVVHCGDRTCGADNQFRVLGAAGYGDTALGLDAAGHPFVAYYDSVNGDLRLAALMG